MNAGFHFERTFDREAVRGILTHPNVYRHLGDDGAPPVETFEPQMHPAIWYILPIYGGQPAGCFVLHPKSVACWEIHAALLPPAWGWSAFILARAIQWIWEKTGCRRLVAEVPSYNRLALKLARGAGMMEFGVNCHSWLKGGKVHDQVLFGISRPEVE